MRRIEFDEVENLLRHFSFAPLTKFWLILTGRKLDKICVLKHNVDKDGLQDL